MLPLAAGVALAAWAAAVSWRGIAGTDARAVLGLLPVLVLLHGGQLLLASLAWRALLPAARPPVLLLWRLRVIREGVDSLLPVAQVGGEVVGARLLARYVPAAAAGASVVIDMAVEVLTQLAFLTAGLFALVWLSGQLPDARWLILAGVTLAMAAGVLVAARAGLLRGLEALFRGIVRRAPGLAGPSLTGLYAAAAATWQRSRGLGLGIALHLPAWALGSLETWLVLRALGHPVTLGQALVVESLGMAARSAGFAIPAAIGVQEAGFVLAAASIGLGAGPAVTLSLVKRLREVLVGLVGLGLWRVELA